jgi:hypothetical protein
LVLAFTGGFASAIFIGEVEMLEVVRWGHTERRDNKHSRKRAKTCKFVSGVLLFAGGGDTFVILLLFFLDFRRRNMILVYVYLVLSCE